METSNLSNVIFLWFILSIVVLFWDFGDNPGDLYDAIYNSLDKTEIIVSPISLVNQYENTTNYLFNRYLVFSFSNTLLMGNIMKTLKEKIEIMQAALDGEEIEVYSTIGNDWVKTNVPVWNWDNYDYRIKPKPLERWINLYPAVKTTFGYATEKAAKENAMNHGIQIKVREVTDDE